MYVCSSHKQCDYLEVTILNAVAKTHFPIPHIATSTAIMCMWQEIAYSYQIPMQLFMHWLGGLQSGYQQGYSLNAVREFPWQKPYIKCMTAHSTLVKLDIFCCHYSCYQSLLRVRPSIICTSTNSQHYSSNQSQSINHKRHQHKKRPSLGKCAKPEQMLFKSLAPNDLPNNNIVKHCTRALNHPVHETS